MKTELTHPILQYPTDLIFAVTDHNVLPLLTVLQTQMLSVRDYTIHIAIIGESHCITIFREGKFIRQEVLACTDIPAILQANSHKFAKLETYVYDEQDYRARIWFTDNLQTWDEGYQEIMRLNFPEMFGQIPFTEIQWHLSESSIHWRTTHVYPLKTHTTYVYTESYFDLNGRNNNEWINRTNS